MLFEPYCFISFIENNDIIIIKHIDNWTDGEVIYYFFDEDLVINMNECIDILIAKKYLQKLNASHLIQQLDELDCPCYYGH